MKKIFKKYREIKTSQGKIFLYFNTCGWIETYCRVSDRQKRRRETHFLPPTLQEKKIRLSRNNNNFSPRCSQPREKAGNCLWHYDNAQYSVANLRQCYIPWRIFCV